MSKKKITRRRFVGQVGAATGVVALARPGHAAPRPLGPAMVYSAHHENMVNGTTPDTVQYEWVRAGVDACVKAMTGQTSVPAAWETLFPGIDATKKIAIKVNCLNNDVYPQFVTVRALVEGITSMLGGNYPAANVSLFDNNLGTTGKVNACYGSANLDQLGIEHCEDTYASGTTVQIGGTTMYISKYWADAAYGISLAKMSPHHLYAGGLSGVFKNMMGALSLDNNTNYKAKRSNGGFHDGSPYTAWRDLWNNYAADNVHLYMVDMLFAVDHENATGWARVVKRITMGTDPAAVDSYNVDKINELGMNLRYKVTKDVPAALEAAGAGSTNYTLVEPQVDIGPHIPTGDNLDRKIRERMGGQATDAEVKAEIKKYREQ